MPGVNESNVDIDLQGNNLTIKGARDDVGMDDAQLIRGEYRQSTAMNANSPLVKSST